MEIRRFMNSIKRMLWLIILFGVIGGGVTYYTSYYKSVPMYNAETTIYAMSKGSSTSNSDSINYQDVMLSRYLVEDYKEIITSEKVLKLAASQLQKYQITQDYLKGMISVSPKNDSSVIGISVTANDPKLAAEASTAVTQAFMTRLRELTNANIVGILDAAQEPQAPISNNYTKNMVVGVLVGIILALAIIYIRELFDMNIRYVEDLENSLNLKVIGIIPKYGIR